MACTRTTCMIFWEQSSAPKDQLSNELSGEYPHETSGDALAHNASQYLQHAHSTLHYIHYIHAAFEGHDAKIRTVCVMCVRGLNFSAGAFTADQTIHY